MTKERKIRLRDYYKISEEYREKYDVGILLRVGSKRALLVYGKCAKAMEGITQDLYGMSYAEYEKWKQENIND